MGKIDKNTFLDLLESRKEILYRTAFLYVKNERDALDILDETIYKTYSSLNNIKEEKYFNTYITRILINSSIDFLRKKKNLVYLENIEIEDNAKELYEEKLDLYSSIDNLVGIEKTVIILKYFQDQKIREISDIMNLSQSNVKNYLHKALTKLRCDLKEGYNE